MNEAPTSAAPPPMIVDAPRHCIRCGYSVKGLPLDGHCPECNTPVELSIREPMIASSAPEYLVTLRQGISLILYSIALAIFMTVLKFVRITWIPPNTWQLGVSASTFFVSVLGAIGYWRFTSPDPSVAQLESATASRKVVRVVVLVQCVLGAAVLICHLLGSIIATPVTKNTKFLSVMYPANTLTAIVDVLLLVQLVLMAVSFVAVMRYTRLLATRIPDSYIVARARSYMWQLPLLCTVGLLILIGPLVSIFLYVKLLHRLRKHVHSFILTGHRAALPDLDVPATTTERHGPAHDCAGP